jgi:hypothetical protein
MPQPSNRGLSLPVARKGGFFIDKMGGKKPMTGKRTENQRRKSDRLYAIEAAAALSKAKEYLCQASQQHPHDTHLINAYMTIEQVFQRLMGFGSGSQVKETVDSRFRGNDR